MKHVAISIVAALVVGVAAFWLFWNEQSVPTPPTEPTAEETDSAAAEWVTYTNDTYNFSLSHPNDWEVQEALKPQEIRALHEIYIQERDPNPQWRADVTIQVFANYDDLTLMQWWEQWLNDEDAEAAECRAEYGDEAPCLYLRGMLESQTQTTYAGTDALAVELFQFDHTRGCTYFTHDDVILGVCSVVGENPNDPNAAAHRAEIQRIRESLSLDA